MPDPLGAATPIVWSGRLLRHLDNAKVFANLMTRQYEGEIRSMGDSVRILTPSTVTIADYTKYSTTLSPQTVKADAVVLVIDQAKYFSLRMEDIDRVQQKPKLFDEFVRRAAIDMAEAVDDNLATVIANGVATANQLTAVNVGTGAGDDDVYETLVDLGQVLDTNNVTGAGRWCVIPPPARALLLKDPRFVSFGTPQNVAGLRRGDLGGGAGGTEQPSNGRVGQAAGFDLYMSNNLTSGTGTVVVAGHPSGVAYAEQLRKTENRRRDDTFADEYRGLLLFGRKVLDAGRLASVDMSFV